ncbi:DUF998 domain-containing protein [Nocardiopsis sp. N85]|uniref:DUF998 domain-containing protein n=1 Tax=Nocardiopsis sp. N85 TaxID=3029400 RepID=UPI00237F403A|nr:DUF998 domain-containing protein [Nocardiopsis sp. N85]MDE3721345.1 DUF998 domain-containing protein [Nocardiopsis sp. N85]
MTALLWLGALGAWTFVVVFSIDGWTRPGYHPVRHPVSALALGPRGRLQAANFVLCGAAITAGAVAVAGTLDSGVLALAIGVFGLSLIASGVFPMDPMRGYPPGTPDGTPTEVSARHELHDRAGAVVFLSLPVAAVIAAFAVPDLVWKWYSGLTGIVTLALFFAFGQAWENDSPRTGLLQRATIVVGWLWLGLLFAYAAR